MILDLILEEGEGVSMRSKPWRTWRKMKDPKAVLFTPGFLRKSRNHIGAVVWRRENNRKRDLRSNKGEIWAAHIEAIVKTLAFTLCKRRSDLMMLIRRITWSNMFLKDQSDITLEEWAWRVVHVNTKLKINLRIHLLFIFVMCVFWGKRCKSILSLDFPLL